MASELHAVVVDRPVTLVDSSAVLDIVTEDGTWAEWSGAALARLGTRAGW